MSKLTDALDALETIESPLKGSKAELDELLECIKELVDIVKNYHDGECCDHSVGICYCGEYSVLDDAEKLLRRHSTQHPN